MADVREPPPLFEEEDLDSKELENDDDIFQTDKKESSDTSHDILKDEKQDENKFEELDITKDVFSESPVLEKKLDFPSEIKSDHREPDLPSEVKADPRQPDLPSEIKSDTREPEQSLPEPSRSPQKQNGSTNDVVLDSPPEPNWSLRDAPKEVPKETKTPIAKLIDDAPRVSVTESSTMYASVSKPPFGFHATNRKEQPNSEPQEEEAKYNIDITITGTKKVGDGMNAYIVYKVCTKTAIPDFRHTEMDVFRRFSDFLGLRDKLVEKHLHMGVIIPPPPEKSIIGMAKIKVSKEESGSLDFVEQRRAALERFLSRVAQHPVLQTDPNFVDFLELEGDLPKSTSTSALSGAGVLRLFNRVGDSIGKITYKMDETDQWFEEKALQIEAFDLQLRRLHGNLETLVTSRRELAQNTGILAKSVAVLGSSEEHSSLSRALSQLAEVEEKLDKVQEVQADDDFFIFAEFVKDYVGLLQSVKDVFHERIKLYKVWKDNEVALAKKREVKVRMELAHKLDKIQDASREISEWEQHVDKSQQDFERISKNIHKEMKRFEQQRCKDFRRIVIAYLESLLNHEQQIIRHWESFLPEARLIV